MPKGKDHTMKHILSLPEETKRKVLRKLLYDLALAQEAEYAVEDLIEESEIFMQECKEAIKAYKAMIKKGTQDAGIIEKKKKKSEDEAKMVRANSLILREIKKSRNYEAIVDAFLDGGFLMDYDRMCYVIAKALKEGDGESLKAGSPKQQGEEVMEVLSLPVEEQCRILNTLYEEMAVIPEIHKGIEAYREDLDDCIQNTKSAIEFLGTDGNRLEFYGGKKRKLEKITKKDIPAISARFLDGCDWGERDEMHLRKAIEDYIDAL